MLRAGKYKTKTEINKLINNTLVINLLLYLTMWFFYALSFALITSISLPIAKKVMQEMDEYLYLWVTGLVTIPSLFFIVIYFYQIPRIDNIFILATLATIGLDGVAGVLAYRAIKITDLSLVGPISAFNPVFTALISFFILGEVINFRGVSGIILVCFGAYLLQVSKTKNLLDPLIKLLGSKGVQFSFLAYLIWATTPILQKTAIFHTHPQVPPFASLAGFLGTSLIFGGLSLKFSKQYFGKIKKFIPVILTVGIISALAQAAAFIAFSSTNLGLATAVFKTSILFSVLWGWLFFNESGIKSRLMGSVVMLLGIMMLTS